MKKILTSILATLVVGLGFTSCNSGNDTYTTTISYQSSDLMMRVSYDGTNTTPMPNPPGLTLSIDYGNPTISFAFTALELGINTVNVTTPALPYEYTSSGQLQINQAVVNTESIVLDNFKFYAYGNYISVSFNYNGTAFTIMNRATFRYSPDMVQNIGLILYDGKTTTISTYSPQGYETSNTQYGVSFNTLTMTANMYVFSAAFAPQMPSLNMLFENIPFQMGPSGVTLQSDEDIIPRTIANNAISDPYPNYVIKNFNALFPYTGMNGMISFQCSEDNWTVSVSDVVVAVEYRGSN